MGVHNCFRIYESQNQKGKCRFILADYYISIDSDPFDRIDSMIVPELILAVDVHYDNNHAVVAGVIFNKWDDGIASSSHVSTVDQVSDYIPGRFYKRELPCIIQLLKEHNLSPEYILIDGYVYLDGNASPGLGSHLYDALQHKVKVIGVAKKPFIGITRKYEVYRGASKKPLYVTCAGIQLANAKTLVTSMHGDHRIPTLLKMVDQLSRNELLGSDQHNLLNNKNNR